MNTDSNQSQRVGWLRTFMLLIKRGSGGKRGVRSVENAGCGNAECGLLAVLSNYLSLDNGGLAIINNYSTRARWISNVIIQQIVTMPIYGKEALNICHPI